jgi:putative spermidine/putrescine transport system substrate-binding protein
MEYIFSDAGQNTWLKGFALPVRLAAMQTAGTADKAALAAINPPTTAPVVLTPAQIDAAKKVLTDQWKFITIK